MSGIIYVPVADLAASLESLIVHNGFLEVRLQWFNGTWDLHWGDPSFDYDHRGYWGSTSLMGDEKPGDFTQLAKDLIEDMEYDYAMKCN